MCCIITHGGKQREKLTC